jgi:hypothetical protein
MPLEINEIGIRMHVTDGKPTAQQAGDASSGESGGAKIVANEALVRECVRRVLLALKESKER